MSVSFIYAAVGPCGFEPQTPAQGLITFNGDYNTPPGIPGKNYHLYIIGTPDSENRRRGRGHGPVVT